MSVDFPLWVRLGIGAALAAGLAYLTTPLAIATAERLSFYDRPVGYKGHGRPTPYLGGAAVMLAFALAVAVGAGDPGRTLPLLTGVAVLLVVGTIDDRRTVTPQIRVAVELAVGVLLTAAGLGWRLGAGFAVDAAVTGIWVVAVVNSFNLFDNMDGAASTMAAVVSGGACVLAISTGATWAAVGCAALAGACLGFLPHNLTKPAKIFLGDGGSMPLGFAVAALVANAARSAEPSTLALLVGFLLVGIPAVDTCLVIVSRRRRGISVLTGGQDHLTHRTRRRVRTTVRVALVLGAAQALLSALVIVAIHGTSATIVYVLLAFLVCASATIGMLEQVEGFQLIGDEGHGASDTSRGLSAPGGAGVPTTTSSESVVWGRVSIAMLGVLGLGTGLSPLFEAYYGTGVWVPLGLGLVIVAAAALVASPPRLGRPAIVAVCALAGLGLWSLVSSTWSPTVEQATIDANRWLVYAATLLLAIVLIRSRRHAAVLISAVGAGIGIVAVLVIIRLLGAGGSAMFIDGRLNLPLGYINGEGCVFAMGCWLSFALAERRTPFAAGCGAAATVVLACLALLSQSRGAAIAVFAAALLVVLAIPGRRRRLLALATIAVGTGLATPAVLRVYSTAGASGSPTPRALHAAVLSMLLAGAGTGLVWAGLVAADRLIGNRSARAKVTLSRIASVAAICVVLLPAGAAVVKLGSIERTARDQWHAFVHLSDGGSSSAAATQTRLLSGAGNRYDYWRIAWHVFTANPIAGVGAGGYTVAYYKQRRTTEAIENPHSIELELLAELGLIGAAMLVVLITAVAFAARRWRTAARQSPTARTLLVCAAGVAVTWLVDTSGDWMHLLPGVTGVALMAVAVLCYREPSAVGDQAITIAARNDGSRRGRPSALRTVAAAGVGFVLALTGASLMRSGLSQFYLDDARGSLARDPAAALTDANRALRLDGANLNSYYIKAAALARFDDAAASRAVLLQATGVQPSNYVTWVLLGDLEVRAGDIPLARHYYVAASALDPNDPSLAALVANPRSALSSAPAG